MEVHEPYPCILKTPDNSCIVLIHVDDILVVGKRKFVIERLVKCLEKTYTISTQLLEKFGDELSFLKRTMTVQNDGRLTIQVHHRHVQHLCDPADVGTKRLPAPRMRSLMSTLMTQRAFSTRRATSLARLQPS